jgi:hypothetical protein
VLIRKDGARAAVRRLEPQVDVLLDVAGGRREALVCAVA